MEWILFLLLYIQPNIVVEDHVDLIEVNHVYDENGVISLDQIILWDYNYSPITKKLEFVVVAWCNLSPKLYREQLSRQERIKRQEKFNGRWIKKYGRHFPAPNINPNFIWRVGCPRYDHERKLWFIVETKSGIIRKIYGTGFKESWTQYDPEIENKDILPSTKRRQLQWVPHPYINLRWKYINEHT